MKRGPRAGHVGHRLTSAASVLILLGAAPLLIAQKRAPSPAPTGAPAASATVQKMRSLGRIAFGYRTDARPFSYADDSGQPAGYSVSLCRSLADAIKGQPGLAAVVPEWVPVTADDRFRALQEGRIDVLCGAVSVTLGRRAEVSFSIPVFPGGLGALVHADASARLREVLSGRGQVLRPVWRASAVQALQSRSFVAVSGTTTEAWLAERTRELQIITNVSTVSSYDAGLQRVVDRTADALFGERAVLLDAAKRHARAGDLLVVDRLFTHEPLALAFPRGDEELRLLVDRTLSRFYSSGELAALYTNWFGEPDATALAFFRWNTLPD
jgi:putrescine:ornithine antiporter